MDKQIRDMKKTIARVSLFRAIKNARAVLMGLLVIDFVQRVVYRHPVTGLYILLINVIMPFIIEVITKGEGKETKEKQLPMVQKLYKYERTEYYGQGVTAVLTVMTMWFWYLRTSEVAAMSWLMKMGPVLMLTIYLGVLSVRFFLYFREIEERLNNNKL